MFVRTRQPHVGRASRSASREGAPVGTWQAHNWINGSNNDVQGVLGGPIWRVQRFGSVVALGSPREGPGVPGPGLGDSNHRRPLVVPCRLMGSAGRCRWFVFQRNTADNTIRIRSEVLLARPPRRKVGWTADRSAEELCSGLGVRPPRSWKALPGSVRAALRWGTIPDPPRTSLGRSGAQQIRQASWWPGGRTERETRYGARL